MSLSLRSLVVESIFNTSSVAPTIGGARELEKRYGLERCLSISMISFLPETQPPEAPPSALPKVVVIRSTRPRALQYSALPRPFLPIKPVA